MGLIMKNGISYGGGSSGSSNGTNGTIADTSHIELTFAEYQELEANGTVDSKATYFITDENLNYDINANEVVFDDTETQLGTTNVQDTINELNNVMKIYDTKDNIVSFESVDELEPTEFTDVELLQSGEKHNLFWRKASLIFKNVRRLISLMGTTDISGIGNGTVTGGLSELNKNITVNEINLYDAITFEDWTGTVYGCLLKMGKLAILNIGFNIPAMNAWESKKIGTLKSGYIPFQSITSAITSNSGQPLHINTNADGTITLHAESVSCNIGWSQGEIVYFIK